MTLDETIRKAAAMPDRTERARLVESAAAHMRFTRGWNAAQASGHVESLGVDPGFWEELLYEVDSQGF